MRPDPCKHNWRPYTLYKAKCSKCGRAVPWTLLLSESRTEAADLLTNLADVAKVALKLRKKAETDGAACIAYWHVAERHLDALLSVLVEARVVQS